MYIITIDYTFTPEQALRWEMSQAGTCSTDCPVVVNDYIEEIKKTMPYKFKLYDDDGELCFEGYSNRNDDDVAFEPLDWAEGEGCTSIKYWNVENKRYETL